MNVTQAHSSKPGASLWVKRAIALSWFTIAYNTIEGIVSIGFGIGDDSIALAGFGVDSFIEVASAVLVLWRFRSEIEPSVEHSLARERLATLGIGILFLVLAFGILAASVLQLVWHSHPATTFPGVVISTLSLSFMFFLWKAKLRAGGELKSTTVLKDAACSLACIQLSIVLFVGSLIFLIVPALWWVDSTAAILLAAFIAREGWETVEVARSAGFSGGCGCD